MRCLFLIFRRLDVAERCLKESLPDFGSSCLLSIIEVPVEILLVNIFDLSSFLLYECFPLSLGFNLPPSLHLLLDLSASVNKISFICEIFDLVRILCDLAVYLASEFLSGRSFEGCLPDEDSLVTRAS